MKTKISVFAVVFLVLVASWPAAARAGDPFTINITTAGEQNNPDVAVGRDGGFAVVWRAEDQDGDGWGVFARWFDWKGDALTGEVPVNTATFGDQYSPGIGADGQGRFVVVWRDENAGIRARQFDRLGNPLDGEIAVAGPAPVPFQPSLAVNDTGDFVVLWLVYDLPEIRVRARRFNFEGSPLEDATEVAVFTRPSGSYSEDTAVAMLDDRSHLGVWSDGKEVYARRYDAAGDPIAGQFQVSQLDYPYSFISSGVDIGSDSTGAYRIVWWTDINLEEATTMTRTVSPTGVLGNLTDLLLTTVDGPEPGFSMTPNGDFVVTRLSYWPHDLEARRLDKNLVQQGSYDVAGNLDAGWCAPRLDHGGEDSREFVVVWREQPAGAHDFDIRARIFSNAILIDGFEDGNTSAWSAVIGVG